MTIKYLVKNGQITANSYDDQSLADLMALPEGRRPVFLEETAPLVVAFLASRPTKKSLDTKKVDADVDLIYAQAVGNRSLEYTTAEVQAQAYKDDGYTGTIPPFVASWVAASDLTATDAANNILGQAVAWRGAVEAIRANRLIAKKNIANDMPTAMSQWSDFVAAIRGQLGL